MDKASKDWKEFWAKRSKRFTRQPSAYISGWCDRDDSRHDDVTKRVIASVIELLELKKGDRILDIGCGAGVFARELSRVVSAYTGVDYIPDLIAKAKNENPHLDFAVASANRLPFPGRVYNKVLAMSIFQYFPSYLYAREVVSEMKRVCCSKGRVLIFDVPDQEKRAAALEARKESGKEKLTHLFYKRSFFKGKVLSQNIEEYLNSPFRFNVYYDIA